MFIAPKKTLMSFEIHFILYYFKYSKFNEKILCTLKKRYFLRSYCGKLVHIRKRFQLLNIARASGKPKPWLLDNSVKNNLSEIKPLINQLIYLRFRHLDSILRGQQPGMANICQKVHLAVDAVKK